MARKTIIKNARTEIPVPAPAADDVVDPIETPDEPDPVERDDAPERDLDDPELDVDPDTSLVGSIYLHLLAEHTCYDALRLDDDDALTMHDDLHQHGEYPHPVEDLRFRPARALAASVQVDVSAPPA